ncbi:class I SAM-dependent methyltransferase [Acidithrix ferrooxidans]|uniref:Demethylmenaquinone methyltransferase n=1 Tax=Acidithrix ferrooxidans TaxID=1280514 RepID=A0A0D8HGH5_9ACTN|nr:class I SAM-dependent methyltransferase [Acidithrix ferrooxidans]KJF17095.1 demethylmenaquinone methyltransferase [Acidithrix ferrooxidans]
MSLIYLQRALLPLDALNPGVGMDHPMRKVVRQVAFERDGWTKERAKKVGDLFDSMAEDWSQRSGAERTEALLDGLNRAQYLNGRCLEIGCGTGSNLELLCNFFGEVVGIDLSLSMLLKMTTQSPPVINCDASCLPFSDESFDSIVIQNSFLFRDEVLRLLRPSGALFWVSTNADRTPIYLSPYDVHKALGADFNGVTSLAGNGIWSAFSRSMTT